MVRNGREIIPNEMIEEPTQFVDSRSSKVEGWKGFFVYCESTEDLFLFREDVRTEEQVETLYANKKLVKIS